MASALDELLLQGLTGRTPWKAECAACATTNVTRSGEQTINGIALVAGDSVLLTGQTAPKENGVYVVSTGAWARRADFASKATARIGSTFPVARGTAAGVYRLTVPTSGEVTPGVTSLTFAKVAEYATAASGSLGDPAEIDAATGGVVVNAGSAATATADVIKMHSEAGFEVAVNDTGDISLIAASGGARLEAQGSGDAELFSANETRVGVTDVGGSVYVGTAQGDGESAALVRIGDAAGSGTHAVDVLGRVTRVQGVVSTDLGVSSSPTTLAGSTLTLDADGGGTSNGAILDWLPLVPDYTTPANASGRSGAYTSAALVFDSTIDPSYEMTCGSVYDNGVAAQAVTDTRMLPILLMLHGYSGTSGSWGDPERLLMADLGYFVITTTKRGNASSPHSAGGADDARDRQDIVDAIAAAVAAHPTFLDGEMVDIFGVSGGSYDALTLVTRYPGRFRNVVASQLGGDLGVNPGAAASYWGTNDNRTEVEARVGTRASGIAPYRARNAMTSLVDAVKQSTTKLFLLWDTEDTIGITLRSARTALEQGGAPRSRWYCEESTIGSDLRWSHGYPADNADLFDALNILANRIGDPAPTAQTTGEYIVTGHCVSAAGWECWTAATSTANCKNDSTGGQDHVVRVIYDAASGQFLVEPLSGACAVTFIWGGDFLTVEAS